MTPEHRGGCEFRVAGRTLSGVAMRYGDTSQGFSARFEAGALSARPPRAMELDRLRFLGIVHESWISARSGPREGDLFHGEHTSLAHRSFT